MECYQFDVNCILLLCFYFKWPVNKLLRLVIDERNNLAQHFSAASITYVIQLTEKTTSLRIEEAVIRFVNGVNVRKH